MKCMNNVEKETFDNMCINENINSLNAEDIDRLLELKKRAQVHWWAKWKLTRNENLQSFLEWNSVSESNHKNDGLFL